MRVFNSLISPTNNSWQFTLHKLAIFRLLSSMSLPVVEIDWRTKNVITIIKSQGQCGSCLGFWCNRCSWKLSSSINHTVLIFRPLETAWKIKKSCANTWGESGYIRLARGYTCAVYQGPIRSQSSLLLINGRRKKMKF